MRRTLQSLRVGQRFVCCGLKGKLVELNTGSATVDIERDEERVFRTQGGEEVRIRRSKDRTTWSLNTEVEVAR